MSSLFNPADFNRWVYVVRTTVDVCVTVKVGGKKEKNNNNRCQRCVVLRTVLRTLRHGDSGGESSHFLIQVSGRCVRLLSDEVSMERSVVAICESVSICVLCGCFRSFPVLPVEPGKSA